MEPIEISIDGGNPKARMFAVRLISEMQREISGLRDGEWRVEAKLVRYRKRRSDRQNRYYHPCFVAPFANFLRAQGEEITNYQSHTLIKAKFLRQTVLDKETKNPIGQKIGSTTELNTMEFNEFLDRVALWLFDQFGIVVPDPSVYRETVERSNKKHTCGIDGDPGASAPLSGICLACEEIKLDNPDDGDSLES